MGLEDILSSVISQTQEDTNLKTLIFLCDSVGRRAVTGGGRGWEAVVVNRRLNEGG